jgi:hypothetical protein
MTKDEMEKILASILDKEDSLLDTPSQNDWDELSKKFSCKFSDDFKYFIELMSKYIFPGDIFNVSTGITNGNDSISLVYDCEVKAGGWDLDMIPFYGIGNGDYFCISAKESPNSSVYYFYHDDIRLEKYSDSFEEWVKELPTFLV